MEKTAPKEKIIEFIESIQSILTEFADDEDQLLWLDDVCYELTNLCAVLKNYLKQNKQNSRENIELILLCLRQLICCISNMETVIKNEKKSDVKLTLCREHFIERMIWCFSRLLSVVDPPTVTTKSNTEQNIVICMDTALDLIAPLTLCPLNQSETINVNTNELTITEFYGASLRLRSYCDQLIEHILPFICLISTQDKTALNRLCQRLMQDSIEFVKMCEPKNDESEKDKRLKAQHLEDSLLALNRLTNDCLLREILSIFTALNRKPVEKLRLANASGIDRNEIDKSIEQFDNILDKLIQIGLFVIAYSQNVKTRSNLQSCLASCEALGSDLIPSILSNNVEHDVRTLETHWNDTIATFQRTVHEIIDTQAFCSIVIDEVNQSIRQMNNSIDKDNLRLTINFGWIFYEHLLLNADYLDITTSKQFELYLNDLKIMLNECKASLCTEIQSFRVRKRFRILTTVLRNIEKIIDQANDNEKNEMKENRSGHMSILSMTKASGKQSLIGRKQSDSLEVLVDLEELQNANRDKCSVISSTDKSVFYETFRRSRRMTATGMPSTTTNATKKNERCLKNELLSTKRTSRRTSMRVAMFKRQKSIETRQFLENLSTTTNSQVTASDALSLQITDILDQLTLTTT